MKGHVYLVGMPGSGKSSAGRSLAGAGGTRFVDLDAHIEEVAGSSIAEIFREQGEEAFRDLEEAALRRVANDSVPSVVACGGGIVLRESNRSVLRATGTVVYLHAPLNRLRRRVKVGAPSRPLLREPGDLERLFSEREPLYRKVAHHVVETNRDPALVVESIRAVLA